LTKLEKYVYNIPKIKFNLPHHSLGGVWIEGRLKIEVFGYGPGA